MNRGDAISSPRVDWPARADAVFPGGLIGRAGLPRALRFTPVRGRGARLYDRDGR